MISRDGILSFESDKGRFLHQGDLVASLREASAQSDSLTNLVLPKIIDYIEGLGK